MFSPTIAAKVALLAIVVFGGMLAGFTILAGLLERVGDRLGVPSGALTLGFLVLCGTVFVLWPTRRPLDAEHRNAAESAPPDDPDPVSSN